MDSILEFFNLYLLNFNTQVHVCRILKNTSVPNSVFNFKIFLFICHRFLIVRKYKCAEFREILTGFSFADFISNLKFFNFFDPLSLSLPFYLSIYPSVYLFIYPSLCFSCVRCFAFERSRKAKQEHGEGITRIPDFLHFPDEYVCGPRSIAVGTDHPFVYACSDRQDVNT